MLTAPTINDAPPQAADHAPPQAVAPESVRASHGTRVAA